MVFKIKRLHGNHSDQDLNTILLKECERVVNLQSNPSIRNEHGKIIDLNKPSVWIGFRVDTDKTLSELQTIVGDRYIVSEIKE